MILRGKNGTVRLGQLLGKGAEGAVYALEEDPGNVAKVYLSAISREREEKLRIMPEILTPELARLTAWPNDLLFHRDGKIGGFVMPNIGNSKDVHCLYGPKSRLSDFPHADWRLLVRAALNVAKAFHLLQSLNCLVGDVNHGGVRIAKDATVRLIDCDSFQITRAGKVHICEVGTDQFTPPELQGAVFRNTPRTANHDNFGLAVLIFLLLQMGRHPFAGRYHSNGDMPIPKAIGEYRYAYSSNTKATLMSPPPHTARPDVASPEIALLWERAFSRDGAGAGRRPTTLEWISALSSLEKRFGKCSANPSHFYFSGYGSCPWCPIESIGVILFGIQLAAIGISATPGLDITVVWKQILGTPRPTGAAWTPPNLTFVASKKALNAKRKRGEMRLVAVLVTFLIFMFGLAMHSGIWPLWIAVAVGVGVLFSRVTGDHIVPFRELYIELQRKHDGLLKAHLTEAELTGFDAKFSDLRQAHDEWKALDDERRRGMEALIKDRKNKALERFLDRHYIRSGKISGIGPAKSSMLESYGIETAADISSVAIKRVPGFGPALARRLLDWKGYVTARFVFNQSAEVDRRDVVALENSIALKRTRIENRLRPGVGQLQQQRQAILQRREALSKSLHESFIALGQARVNLDIFG